MTATMDDTETTADVGAVTPTLGLTGPQAAAYGYPLHTPVLVFTPTAESRTGMVLILSTRVSGHAPRERHLSGLGDADRAWIEDAATRHTLTVTWNNPSVVRVIGPLPNAERLFEDANWAYAQIPGMVQRQLSALEQRVGEALKREKESRSWCSELEDEWLPQMRIAKEAVRQPPEYRTFEIEVEFVASATVKSSQTVTVAIDGDGEEEVRRRAVEQAEEAARSDLKSEVDFAVYGYSRADVTYEYSDADTSEEWDSDEDGDPVDD